MAIQEAVPRSPSGGIIGVSSCQLPYYGALRIEDNMRQLANGLRSRMDFSVHIGLPAYRSRDAVLMISVVSMIGAQNALILHSARERDKSSYPDRMARL